MIGPVAQVFHGFVGFSESVSEIPNLRFGMDYARSNIIFLICLVFAGTFPDVEAQTTSESAPSVTVRPHNKSVIVGSGVIFNCEVSGASQPTNMTWVKYSDSGATAITPGGNGLFLVDSDSLFILSVALADAGHYGCIAQNEHGKLVADAFLTIMAYAPLTWKTKPHNVTLYNGQKSYSLGCFTHGFPQASDHWTKNGSQISDKDMTFMRHLLIFRVARTRHTGWYTCIAHNVHGTIAQSAYVEVVNDPSIIIQPESASVVRGKSVTLSCGVVGSDMWKRGRRITWTKNNKKLKRDAYIRYTHEMWRNVHIFSLTINRVKKHHRGKYRCVVTNAQGSARSDVARVSLTRSATPLSVTAVQPFIIATGGSDVELECIFNGSVTSGITWYKDRVKVTLYRGDELIVNNKHKAFLTLTEVTPSVAGNYVCKGSSPSGSAEANISLVVKGATAPDVKPLKQIQVAKQNSSANIKFVIASITPPDFLLYKDGEKLHNATYITWYDYDYGMFRFELTIPSVQYNDSGFYTCFAQNQFGVSSGNVSLIVKGIPDAPTNVTVKNLSPGVVLISWVPEFDGGATCWFNVQFKKSDESEWTSVPLRINTTTAELKNSDDWDGMFVFNVTAVNQFGSSVPKTVSVELKENKNNGQQQQREDGSSSTGVLVGSVIGGLVFVALVIVLVFVLRRQKRKSRTTSQKQLLAVAYAAVRPIDLGNYDRSYINATEDD